MISIRRFPSSLPGLRSGAGRLLASLLASTAGLLAVLSLGVAPAGAIVAKVEVSPGVTTTVGLQPREASRFWYYDGKYNGLGKSEVEPNPAVVHFGNPQGHEVVHSANTYAIYWDPSDYYHGDWQGLIDGFLANLGAAGSQLSSVFAVDGQYTDTTNKPAATTSTFHGAYTDTHPYPETGNCVDPHPMVFNIPLLEDGETVCLTDAQVRVELARFIKQHEEEHYDLPKGMGTVYYLMTPPGVTICLDDGGPTGQCSDFDGTSTEISQYEEASNKYPEELEKYPKEKAKWEEEKKEKEEKHETPPVEPKAPVKPTRPASYSSYEKSFCSYHGAIGSGSSTVLYGAIPWTAGGDGDGHLAPADQTPAFACQDGGFQPAPESGELQEKEREKVETLLEKEELAEKDAKEKREHQEAIEEGLAKPHDQEPNQGSCPSLDGSCDAGLADLIINQIAVEQQNIVTDPLLDGWQDSEGHEVTDECRNFFFSPAMGGGASALPRSKAGTLFNQKFGSGDYYLNETYNLAAVDQLHPGKEFPGLPYPGINCLSGIRVEPMFTAPNTVKGGEVVGFDGMESDITLGSAVRYSGGVEKPNYATYTWNFGDGNRGDKTPEVSGYAPGAPACEEPWLSPCAASVFHTYKYSGTYDVTLTVKDVAGNEASVTNPITVEGEPWPEGSSGSGSGGSSGGSGTAGSAGSSGSASSSTSSSSTSGSATPGVASKPPVPNPVAAAATVSKSLSQVLRSGLVVRYSVNEQVAGRFEVLLASSIAKRIGLHGSPATGLPRGTAPQIVIAKAILVTTKGGRNTIKILFGKTTAARLRKLRKVSLMLRLIVRNASSQNPVGTTVISTINLGR